VTPVVVAPAAAVVAAVGVEQEAGAPTPRTTLIVIITRHNRNLIPQQYPLLTEASNHLMDLHHHHNLQRILTQNNPLEGGDVAEGEVEIVAVHVLPDTDQKAAVIQMNTPLTITTTTTILITTVTTTMTTRTLAVTTTTITTLAVIRVVMQTEATGPTGREDVAVGVDVQRVAVLHADADAVVVVGVVSKEEQQEAFW